MYEFEHLVILLDECDADVGDKEHSRKTVRKMLKIMFHIMLGQLRLVLSTPDQITGFCPKHSP